MKKTPLPWPHVLNLKAGDVLVFRSDDLDSASLTEIKKQLQTHLKSVGKIGVLGLPMDADLTVLRGSDLVAAFKE